MEKILLGYEMGSGEQVFVPRRHMAVTGQTQEAGKTTTLEALINRSGLRALAFIVKRYEVNFQRARRITPCFREQADWQYVTAMLEAALREKLKFERSWIMKVCRGARTLADVQAKITALLDGKKLRSLDESVYTTLQEYIKVILPQIESLTFSDSVDLQPGINVMDLSEMTLEMQSLVIRASLEWIADNETETVTIIPEAWEFVPQNRASPVKAAIEHLVRKGGSGKNFLWLDSQDIAVVHKDVMRSISVYIVGVQRERNEVKRVLDSIPNPKPKADDVMTLGLGEFFAAYGKSLFRVFVAPAWANLEDCQKYAMGDGPLPTKDLAVGEIIKITSVNRINLSPQRLAKEQDDMWREKLEASEKLLRQVAEDFASYKKTNLPHAEAITLPAPCPPFESQQHRAIPGPGLAVRAPLPEGVATNIDVIYEEILTRLRAEDPAVIVNLAMLRPEVVVTVKRAEITMNGDSLRSRIVELIANGFFDKIVSTNAATNELKRLGVTGTNNTGRELSTLNEMRILTREDGGYRKNPEAIIRKER